MLDNHALLSQLVLINHMTSAETRELLIHNMRGLMMEISQRSKERDFEVEIIQLSSNFFLVIVR